MEWKTFADQAPVPSERVNRHRNGSNKRTGSCTESRAHSTECTETQLLALMLHRWKHFSHPSLTLAPYLAACFALQSGWIV